MAIHRIGLCITDLNVGGAEQCLSQLATRLDRQRFEPVVYCLASRPQPGESSCVPILTAAGVDVHFLDATRALDFPRTVRRLRHLLRAHRPQLLQCFLFHANLVGRLAARSAGIPRVLCGVRVAEREKRWHLRLDQWTGRWVDRWVCVSESVTKFSIGRGGLPAGKIVVIPNGIDASRYPATPANLRSLGVPADRRAVTFVGRLEHQKGLDWLLATASDWLGQLPNCDLVLVGSGPERASLEELVGRLGLCGRVHFLGWRANVAEILAASELLLLPSRWEGMPNVVLEAMATALPILATDVEGVRELLGEAAEPQTVPFGDSAAWTGHVANILGDPQRAAQLGAQNRQRAEAAFGLERMVAAYEELWAALIH